MTQAVSVIPNAKVQFFNGSGQPLAYGKVYMYVPGTTTPKNTWSDYQGTVLNANPIILDGNGEAQIFGTGSYRQQVYDQAGILWWDQVTSDPIGVMTQSGTNIDISNCLVTPSGNTDTTQQTLATMLGQALSPVTGLASIYQYGGKGDNSTNNNAAFASAEASAFTQIYLPTGTYLTTDNYGSLKKNYVGPGAILFNNNITSSGTPSNQKRHVYAPGSYVGGQLESNYRTYVFIGDSITADPVADPNNFFMILNQKVSSKLNAPLCSFPPQSLGFNSPNVGLFGSWAIGTSGPVQQSWIFQPSAGIQITCDYCDSVSFWYKQNGSTAGVVTITDNGNSGISETITTSTGSVDSYWSGNNATPAFRRNGQGIQHTLTVSGAAVEINGFQLTHFNSGQGVLLQRYAYPGYSTSSFTATTVLADIVRMTINNVSTSPPVYVLAIGNNDIYNNSTGNTVANYIANLTTICNYLTSNSTNCQIILTIPTQRYNNAPVYAPFVQYRDALYQFAQQYNYEVVDLSEFDFDSNPSLWFVDGQTHPSLLGNRVLADYWFEKLHFPSITENEYQAAISPQNSFIQSTTYNSPLLTTVRDKKVTMGGVFTPPGSNPGLPVIIGQLDPSACPVTNKIVHGVTYGSTQAQCGSAIIEIIRSGTTNVVGYLKLLQISATTWPTSISVDGISYSLET